MIELKNISHTLGNFSLKNISFQVESGTYFVLLGESGAGKSVLLEMIAGLLAPDHGSILLHEDDITHATIQSRGIGLVYQDQSLFPHLSVSQNISYPLKCRKRSKKEIQCIVNDLAEKTGVSHLLHRNTATLSLGEGQRTALARTLATAPKLLLLDEPLASLDVQSKAVMRSLLRKLNSEGLTIIHVTHDYKEALSLADQLAVMENGTVAQTGTPEEIFGHPKSEFIANFTGIKNFYEGSIRRISDDLAVFRTAGLEFDIVTEEPDGQGYLLLRTQDITLSNHETDTSSRNHIKGTVTEIEPVQLGVEITVDIGVPVTAMITRESMNTLGITLDHPLWIHFKAVATRFIAEESV